MRHWDSPTVLQQGLYLRMDASMKGGIGSTSVGRFGYRRSACPRAKSSSLAADPTASNLILWKHATLGLELATVLSVQQAVASIG